MGLLRGIGQGVRGLFGKRRADDEMDEELRGYLDAAADDSAQRGASTAEAMHAARVRMGSAESVKEGIREATWEGSVESLWRDVAYGFRLLTRQLGYSATAILTLALGIGVNATIFSLYNAVVLKPMSATDPSTLISLYQTKVNEKGYGNFSYPGFAYIRDNNAVFSEAAAYGGARVLLGSAASNSASGEGTWVQAQLVPANYFEILGAKIAVGRAFASDENTTPEKSPVAILENGFWRQQFGADPKIVGKNITLNLRTYTVVGVAQPGFTGATPDVPDLWVPLMMSGNVHFGNSMLDDPNSHWLEIIARLKPGVTLDRARAEMAVVAQRMEDPKDRKQPAENESTIVVTPASYLDPGEKDQVLPIALLIMAAVGLVLLIACANVANLQLARGVSRNREMGMRASLGASRLRLMRQLLIESLWLAGVAGVVGLLVAWWAADIVRATVHPAGAKAIAIDVQPDWHVAAYLVVTSLLAGMAAGILPALRISRQDPLRALRGEGPLGSGSRLRSALVVCQVASSIFLLVAAGLAVRSLGKARAVDPGFDVDHVVVVDASLRASGFKGVQGMAAVDEIAARAKSLPGVVNVATARTVPLGQSFSDTVVSANGTGLLVSYNSVSPNYFDTLGIRTVAGRTFTQEEAKASVTKRAPVAILSGALARKLWPGQDAVGKQLHMGFTDKGPVYDVVGVAADVRSVYLWSQDSLSIYLLPTLSDEEDRQDAKIFVRTAGNPSAALTALPGIVRNFNSSVPVKCSVLAENLAAWIWPSQIAAMVAGVLGSLALFLAAVGVASVTAFAVSQRKREIGIRMALGSDARGVVRLLIWQSGRLIAIGAVIGLVLAAVASTFARALLYGLSAVDAGAFVGVTLLLAVVGFVACYLPARRAANVDPMIALRYE